MRSAAQALGIVVAGYFALPATAKLATFRAEAQRFWLPRTATRAQRFVLLAALITAEYGVAFALIHSPNVPATTLLVWTFIPALTVYGRGSIDATGSCGCLGSASRLDQEGSSRKLLLRNTLLLAGATASLWLGHGEQAASGEGWPISQTGLLIALLLPWIGVAVLALAVVTLQASLTGRRLLQHTRRLLEGVGPIP